MCFTYTKQLTHWTQSRQFFRNMLQIQLSQANTLSVQTDLYRSIKLFAVHRFKNWLDHTFTAHL